MNRIFTITLAALVSVFSFAVEAQELIHDSAFESGYVVASPVRDKYKKQTSVEGIHQVDNLQKSPVWQLVQWGSKKSLAGVSPLRAPDGSVSWTYERKEGDKNVTYKRVTLGAIGNSAGNRVLGLELNGLAEFESLRADDIATPYLPDKNHHWPHLLMMQEIDAPSLDHYRHLDFQFDARLLFDDPNIQPDAYDKRLHAARFVTGFLVRNILHGGSFWLMLVIYDDRFPESGFSCKKCTGKNKASCRAAMTLDDPGVWSCEYDGERPRLSWQSFPADLKKGTQHMIFRIPSSAFRKGKLTGEWQHHHLNLLPYLDAAICAHQEGEIHERKRNAAPIDQRMFYTVRLFSVGWEITGLNHAAAEIKGISLKGD